MTESIHVHMLSGSAEYQSEATLTVFQNWAAGKGVTATLSRGEECGTHFPDLDLLEKADVLLVFCKRMELDPGQLARIQEWCRSGRPVVGLRTASHAFQNWLEFDAEILGGSYSGHDGDEASVRLELVDTTHPITADLAGWDRPAKLYHNATLGAGVSLLATADGAGGTQPVAWCRKHPETGGRVFYTSMGCIHDFGDTSFNRLLLNAIRWAAGAAGTDGSGKRYWVAHLEDIDSARCPCGFSRRAFLRPDNPLATLHMVDITVDARTHYHKKLTEIYLVLEGEGYMELDGERVPVKPMSAIFIKPGCRHRAVGKMRIVNMPIPSFDPSDEWFDDSPPSPGKGA